jgi:hypothetical protein
MLVLLLAAAAGLVLLLQPNDPASTPSDARSPAGAGQPADRHDLLVSGDPP